MRRFVFAMPLLAACATTPATPRAPAPSAPPGAWVELRFDWRPGLTATVETTHVRTAPGRDGLDRAEVQVRSRLAVEAAPAGVAVRTRELSHRGPVEPTPVGVELLAVELAAPDRIVGKAGNLIGVEAREAAKVELNEALVALSRVEPIPAAFRDRLLERLEPPALTSDASAEWDRLVGFWAGASLQAGRTYAARDLVPLDLLADLPIEAEVRMHLVDRVPCEAGEAELRCVALELVIAPDEEALRRVAPFLARLFGGGDGEPRLAYDERTLLVTEPAGLVPHRLVTTRTLAVALGANGADRYERIDERTVAFDYASSGPSSSDMVGRAGSSATGTRSSSQHARSSR